MVKSKAKIPPEKIQQKVSKTKSPAYKKVKTILISQPPPETGKNPYADLADKYKVKIDFRPFTVIEGISGKDFRKHKVNPVEYSAVVFNSRNAVDHFFRICDEMRMRMSQDTKYFCISEAVALYLQKYILYRKRKVFYGNGKENDLIELMLKHRDTERFLLPCSDMHKEGLAEVMETERFVFDKAIIYRALSSDLSDMKKKFNYDIIAFFSPSGLKSLFENFPKFKQNTTRIAAFGKTTAKAVLEFGLKLDIEAPLPELPSMASALDNYLASSNRR